MLNPRLRQGIRVANELGLKTGLRSTGRRAPIDRSTLPAVRNDIMTTLSLMNPTAEQAFPMFAKEIVALKEARDFVISMTPAGLANDVVTLFTED